VSLKELVAELRVNRREANDAGHVAR